MNMKSALSKVHVSLLRNPSMSAMATATLSPKVNVGCGNCGRISASSSLNSTFNFGHGNFACISKQNGLVLKAREKVGRENLLVACPPGGLIRKRQELGSGSKKQENERENSLVTGARRGFQTELQSLKEETESPNDGRDALQLRETVETVDLFLAPASDDEDSQQGDDKIAQELAAMTGTISISEHVPIALRSVCVGIDPDLSGAIAVLRTEDDTVSAEVIDVPCVTVAVNKKMRRRHDYEAIANLVRQLQAPEGSIAYVEQAMPFPKDGKQGWYITGYGYGVWLGILAAAGFTVIPVQAKAWKAAMGICGKEFTKDDSRALASSIFPALSPQLKRKKDHGRAEALLIAAFGKGMALTHLPAEVLSSKVVEM